MIVIKSDFGSKIDIAASTDEDRPLMVCSHERSGTHYLMNSIANTTHFTQDPFINFDIFPLGAHVNFFDSRNVNNFCKYLRNIKHQDLTLCTVSILKSHFPVSLVKEALKENLRVIYIYRNPVDTLISYWKFLHRWDWLEGPKTKTPFQLCAHPPAGQSQRYQMETYHSYFERWEKHVADAFYITENNDNIVMVRYSDLKNDYENTISKCCDELKIKVGKILQPSKQNYIKGKSLDVDLHSYQEVYEYCSMQLASSKILPKNVMSA